MIDVESNLIQIGKEYHKVSEVVRLEANSNYTIVHLHGRRSLLTSKVLARYAEQEGCQSFIRTHSKHLINPLYIVEIRAMGDEILLKDESAIKIARSRKKKVAELISLYSGKNQKTQI
jgi:two-component system, LytTR family, response regulator